MTKVNVSIITKVSLLIGKCQAKYKYQIRSESNLIFHVKHELRLCFRAWNVCWQLVAAVALWSLACDLILDQDTDLILVTDEVSILV